MYDCDWFLEFTRADWRPSCGAIVEIAGWGRAAYEPFDFVKNRERADRFLEVRLTT